MAKFPYKPRAAGSLKQATADLVDACGGLKPAAGAARVGRTALFRYTDDADEHADRYMPVDIVAALEARCGEPIVTEWLALEAGCVLMRLPAGAPESWVKTLSRLNDEHSDVIRSLCEALDNDGEIDAREAGAAIEEIDEDIRALGTLRAQLVRIRDGGAS